MAISYCYLSLTFLVFSLILFALKTSLSSYSSSELSEILSVKATRPLIFLKSLLPGKDNISLITLFSLTKATTLLAFYTSSLLFFIVRGFPYSIKIYDGIPSIPFLYFLFSSIILALITLIPLSLSRVITLFCKKGTLKALTFPACIPLFFFLPLTYPIIYFQKKLSPKELKKMASKELVKKQLLDILSQDAHKMMDITTKRFITSLAYFDDKTCREIMVPRLRIQCLENTSSIFEALTLFIEEGYSRIPIYDKSIDHITGVLLYKDVLEYTFKRGMGDFDTIKKAPITSLVTPILYAPENKKISELFQVMRVRKIHATIVVNEYGCTEGLVTIEDIFEELIGSEILDEHDEEDELLYKKTHDQGWIVEADLSIIDAEREFGIELPHDSEYETIGGLISTTLGVIPKPGSVIHFDLFEIKVLSSTERKILKVKVSFPAKESLPK